MSGCLHVVTDSASTAIGSNCQMPATQQIVRQRMGLFSSDESAASEIIG